LVSWPKAAGGTVNTMLLIAQNSPNTSLGVLQNTFQPESVLATVISPLITKYPDSRSG